MLGVPRVRDLPLLPPADPGEGIGEVDGSRCRPPVWVLGLSMAMHARCASRLDVQTLGHETCRGSEFYFPT